MKTARTLVILLGIGALILSGFHLAGILSCHLSQESMDYPGFYMAGHHLLKGVNPYDLTTGEIQEVFAEHGVEYTALRVPPYPPMFHLSMVPFSLLPFQVSQVLWLIVKVLLLAWSFILVLTGFTPWRDLKTGDRILFLSVMVILTSGFLPLWLELMWGQVNIFLLWSLTLAALHLAGRPVISGVVTGFGASMKSLPVILLPYFAARREWRALNGSLLFIGTAGILSLILMGPRTVYYYLRWIVLPMFTGTEMMPSGNPLSDILNRSLKASLLRLGEAVPALEPWVPILGILSILALIGLVILFFRRCPMDRGYEIAFLAALLPLLTPLAWPHLHVVLLLPLWVLAGSVAVDLKRGIPVIALMALVYPFLAPWNLLPEYFLSPIMPSLLVIAAFLTAAKQGLLPKHEKAEVVTPPL